MFPSIHRGCCIPTDKDRQSTKASESKSGIVNSQANETKAKRATKKHTERSYHVLIVTTMLHQRVERVTRVRKQDGPIKGHGYLTGASRRDGHRLVPGSNFESQSLNIKDCILRYSITVRYHSTTLPPYHSVKASGRAPMLWWCLAMLANLLCVERHQSSTEP